MYNWLLLLLILSVCRLANGEEIETTTVNVTCRDIKTSEGFRFLVNPVNPDPVDSVEITQNGIKVFHGAFEALSNASDGRTKTLPNCINTLVTFIHNTEGGTISESRLDILVTETSVTPSIIAGIETSVTPSIIAGIETSVTPSIIAGIDTSMTPTIIVVIVVGVLVLVGVVVAVLLCCTKKGRGCVDKFLKQRGTSSVPEHPGDDENRKNAEQETLLDEKGENGMSNGGPDVSINMETLTTDKNSGDEIAPQVNGILLHNELKGNMGHDPGGGKEDTTLHCNRDLSRHEESTGEQRICCDKDDGCSSTFNQRSTREEPFDKTAGSEGRAPVHGVGPGSASISPPDIVDKEDNHKAAAIMLNNDNNTNNNIRL